MPAFEYEALDTNGRTQKGTISSENARNARKDLRAKNLIPTRLELAAEKKGLSRDISFSGGNNGKLSHKDVTLFTRQLATMVGASAPIEEALNTIALQAEKPALKRIILAVRSNIIEGHKLSEAMTQHNKSFDQLYCAMVAAGENSGSLSAVLNRLADHMERAQAVRAKVQTALIYPAALSLVAIGVIIALMTFVVPKVVEQFDSMGRALPFLTRAMISISEFIQNFGLFILVGIIFGIITFIRALKTRSFRKKVDQFILGLPIIGKLVRGLNAARLARTLSTLISSGVPVLSGLRAAQKTVSNTVLQDAIDKVIIMVEEGASLSAALKRTTGFPPMVAYMAAAGENSGKLEELLGKSADYLENEFESFTSAALSLLEPMIIIMMGGIVAVIVLSILLPILQLNTLAGL
jgi:general secretion pathway protein F